MLDLSIIVACAGWFFLGLYALSVAAWAGASAWRLVMRLHALRGERS